MSEPIKISGVIITFNEERNIERCLKSIKEVVDEIIVVDSFSTDRTEEICKTYGVTFIQHPFEGHIEQKNYAMSCANNDWILSLDADEALDEELKQSIREIKEGPAQEAYEMNRLTNYCGSWIKHCGWYPDKKLRLWKIEKGKWGGTNPHDKVILESDVSTGHLQGDMHHYSCYSIGQHLDQIQKFSAIAAKATYEKGKRSNLLINIILGPFYTFFKKYLLQLGILDGYHGFVISIITAFSRFLKYTKLRELERQNR